MEHQFETEGKATFLKRFPAMAGITTIAAGDFSSRRKEDDKEEMANKLADELCPGAFFRKIIPQHGDKISRVEDFQPSWNYFYNDALISFSEIPRMNPLVLFSLTADCPTVVLASSDHKLISITHSDWKGCRLEIVKKTVAEVKKISALNPESLYAGIFPGICEKCYSVKEDVGKLFPKYYSEDRLDLYAIITDQLFSEGIEPQKIFVANYCSASLSSCCRFAPKPEEKNNPKFFSCRRNKTKERNAVFIVRNPD